jgi:hypothetical protein
MTAFPISHIPSERKILAVVCGRANAYEPPKGVGSNKTSVDLFGGPDIHDPVACDGCFSSTERAKAELDYIAAAVKRSPVLISNLAFADPNFAMYERDFEIVEHIEKIQRQQNWPRSIFASTGKNKKERIAKALRITEVASGRC